MGCYYGNVAVFEDFVEIKTALFYSTWSFFAAYMKEKVPVFLWHVPSNPKLGGGGGMENIYDSKLILQNTFFYDYLWNYFLQGIHEFAFLSNSIHILWMRNAPTLTIFQLLFHYLAEEIKNQKELHLTKLDFRPSPLSITKACPKLAS